MVKTTRARKPVKSKTAGISDEAVVKATGKSWSQWCRLLDKYGCRKMSHKEIAELVVSKHGVGPWWSQMVTVGYEQARGLRAPHETSRGWQAGVSRTMNVSVSRLFKAWSDGATRRKWIGSGDITIRKATKNKSIRMACGDGTSLEVNFYAKSKEKSQVTVQHNKLQSEAEVRKSKKRWTAAMDTLKALLTPKPAARK